MTENLVSGPILAHLARIRGPIFSFFFKNLAPSVTRYHGQISSCPVSEKLIIQSRENLPTDESDLTGRCSTNVERPIGNLKSVMDLLKVL